MTFDRQSALKAFAPKISPITVTEDDVTVDFFARELSAKQMLDLQLAQKKDNWNNEQFVVNMLAQVLCDEKGKPVFSTEDVEQLITWKFGAFNKLSTAVAKVVGLTPPTPAAEGVPSPNV